MENEITDFDAFMMAKYASDGIDRYGVASQIHTWVMENGVDDLHIKMEELMADDDLFNEQDQLTRYFLTKIFPLMLYAQYTDFLEKYNQQKL